MKGLRRGSIIVVIGCAVDSCNCSFEFNLNKKNNVEAKEWTMVVEEEERFAI